MVANNARQKREQLIFSFLNPENQEVLDHIDNLFHKFQTKSRHIVKSIPSRLANSHKLGGTGRDGSLSTCFAVHRSTRKYSDSLRCKNLWKGRFGRIPLRMKLADFCSLRIQCFDFLANPS